MAQSVDPTQPSQTWRFIGTRSRSNDEDSVRAPHQGQQSSRTAPTGRTHDCKRPLRCTPNDLLPGGGHPHMKRRKFITLLGGAAAWPFAARAQQGERMRRIGVLMPLAENDPVGQARIAALREGLEKLGWIEGRNIRIDTRWTTTGDVESMQRYAKELVALQPDLIVTQSTPITATLLQETRTIPIVFALVADPIGSGFVASFAKPGGNVTGFVTIEPTMAGKWLELLKEIAPSVARVAFLFNPVTATYFEYWLNPFKAAAVSFAVEAQHGENDADEGEQGRC